MHRTSLWGLADAASAIAGATNVEDLLRVVTASAQTVIGTHQAVTSRLVDGWADAMSYISLSEKYADFQGFDTTPQGGVGLVVRVTRDNEPLRLNAEQLARHPDWRGLRDAPGHPPLKDYLAVPLVSRQGRNIGLIQLSDKVDGTEFTEVDEATLVQLAHMASATIEHVALSSRLERTLGDLELALDAADMGSWEWDVRSGRVTWSPSMERIYGFATGTFPGTLEAYSECLHPDDRADALIRVQEAMAEARGFEYRHRIVRPDGQERWLEGAGLPLAVVDGHVRLMAGVSRDVTERVLADRELEERTRHSGMAAEVGRSFTSEDPLAEKLRRCAQAVVDHMDGACAGVWTLDDGEQLLELQPRATPPTELDRAYGRVRVGDGLVGLVAGERRPSLVNGLTGDPHTPDDEWARSQGIVAFAGHPLIANGRVVGVLAMFARHPLPESTCAVLTSIADMIAVGIGQDASAATARRLLIHERAAHLALEREKQVIETLHRVGQLVTARLDLHEVVQRVTDLATRLTPAEFGAFFYNVIDEAGEAFMLYALSGAPPEAFERFPMPRNTPIFEPTFRGTEVIRRDDITTDPRYGGNPPNYGMPAGHLPVRSYLAVPVILSTGEVAGGLFFGHPEPGRFRADDERLVVGIAGYAAIAIENARLYDAAQQDITAKQQAYEERAATANELETTVARLGAAEERYRGLVNSLEAIVWEARAEDLRFTFVSPQAESMLGYPVERWIAEPGLWAAMIHPDDREWAVKFCLDSTARGRDHDFEYRVVTADGRIVWLYDVVTVVRDGSGAPSRLRGVIVDITHRKRAQQRETAQLAVSRVLVEATPGTDTLTAIVTAMGDSLGWDEAGLWMVDGDALVCTTLWERPEQPAPAFIARTRETRLRRGIGLPGRVWGSGESAWLEDISSDPNFPRSPAAVQDGIRSGFAFPVTVAGEFFGVIECFSRERELRDEELLHTVGTLATQMGQFLGRMRTQDALTATMTSLRRRSGQLRRLAEVASAVNGMPSLEDTLNYVTEEARHIVGAHRSTITMDSDGAGTRVRTSVSPPGEVPGGEGRSRRPDSPADASGTSGRDWLAAPLTAADGSRSGTIQVSECSDGEFTAEDEAILVQLAETASAAIHRNRLYEERKLVAEALQRPLRPPVLPPIRGVEVAACYRPFGEGMSVGGDFYDVFELADGRWAVMLGDVCGKGPEAAAITGLARQTLWTAAQRSADPEEILAILNKAILREDSDRFCTVALALLDPQDGQDGHDGGVDVRLALGGHPSPLLVTGRGEASVVPAGGRLLGPFPESLTPAVSLHLNTGEALVLYSDGLTEGGGSGDIGTLDLRHALGKLAGASASGMVAGLLAVADRRREACRDDLAVLVVRADR
ncbi:MAG: GAF domain-containing protein [Carbonactinosporaceae bacterium]